MIFDECSRKLEKWVMIVVGLPPVAELDFDFLRSQDGRRRLCARER